MFYIEKNDNPNFIEKKFNILKVNDNTITVPMYENMKQKNIEKIARKTEKIIKKYSKSKKIILNKEMQKEELYKNYLNTYDLEIINGKWLFEILLIDIVEYIIKKRKLEKVNISILINDVTDIEIENLKILAQKYKSINIFTNHIEKFKRLEESLNKDEGIVITITNNKKRSLSKSDIVLNIDFPTELVNKFIIKDNAIIVNFKGKIKINRKRFNGLSIYNYEIDYRDDKKEEKALNGKYNLKDIYEAGVYKKQRVSEIREKVKKDKVIIKKLFSINGEL